MAKRTLEQLRSQTWPTFDKAMRELRTNGWPPEGEDYRLGEIEGAWHIVARDDENAGPMPPLKIEKAPAPRDGNVVEIGPKRAAKGAKRPAKDAPTTEDASPPANPPTPPADDAQDESAKDAPEEIASEGKDEAPPASIPPAPEGADLSPMPTTGGPYRFVIGETDVTQSSAALDALDVSRKLGVPITIIGADNLPIRTIDAKIVKAHGKTSKPKREGAGRVGVRGPREGGKMHDATELLLRPKGATAAELKKVTDWDVTDRHIRRLAQRINAGWKSVGNKHWTITAKG